MPSSKASNESRAAAHADAAFWTHSDDVAVGLVSPPRYGAYSASKHAREGLSNSSRLETYPLGIEVLLIEPGHIATNFQDTAKELAQPYVENVAQSPYAKVYAGASAGSDAGRSKSTTTPEDCARVLQKAMEARRPKARCPVTSLTKQRALGKVARCHRAETFSVTRD